MLVKNQYGKYVHSNSFHLDFQVEILGFQMVYIWSLWNPYGTFVTILG